MINLKIKLDIKIKSENVFQQDINISAQVKLGKQ